MTGPDLPTSCREVADKRGGWEGDTIAKKQEDFGAKIGGARKDLWRQRGLLSDDLDAMNDREAEKYVRKENIWHKPDYQAMMDSGIPFDVVYYIKNVRDSIPASPVYVYSDKTPEMILARQKQYVETVREIQSAMEGVRTRKDVLHAFNQCMVQNGYFLKDMGISALYTYTDKAKANPCITKKLANTILVTSEAKFEADFTRGARREQFGTPKEQQAPKGYGVHLYSGGGYSRDNDWIPGTFYVVKGSYVLQRNFTSREDALKWVKEYAGKKKEQNTKKQFIPPQLMSIQRTGPDYRFGRDVTGEEYLGTFGFRGGEFGNWMSREDRRASLNMGYDALWDLAAALQISERDISLQGTLAIAFGARGMGNAAAHYEPMRKVINLTKMHGAGALAHEWWHGLDDFLGGKFGVNGCLSDEGAHKYPSMKKLIDAIKYKPGTKVATEYYRNSTRMAREYWKDGGYWNSNIEMTARAFAVYILDKLPFRSDYLVGHAEAAVGLVPGRDGTPEIIKAYPTGEERKAINAAFDALIVDLKRQHIITHDNDTLIPTTDNERPSVREGLSGFKAADMAEGTSRVDRGNTAHIAPTKNAHEDR